MSNPPSCVHSASLSPISAREELHICRHFEDYAVARDRHIGHFTPLNLRTQLVRRVTRNAPGAQKVTSATLTRAGFQGDGIQPKYCRLSHSHRSHFLDKLVNRKHGIILMQRESENECSLLNNIKYLIILSLSWKGKWKLSYGSDISQFARFIQCMSDDEPATAQIDPVCYEFACKLWVLIVMYSNTHSIKSFSKIHFTTSSASSPSVNKDISQQRENVQTRAGLMLVLHLRL